MAVGNHEFDDGPEALRDFIDIVEFPVISGNTISGANSVLGDSVEPYLIKEIRWGEGRHCFGSGGRYRRNLITRPHGDLILDEIDYLKGAVAELESEGIDKIIAAVACRIADG
jgi:5'-nucleotidase/UDP-sugar diphosphatase